MGEYGGSIPFRLIIHHLQTIYQNYLKKFRIYIMDLNLKNKVMIISGGAKGIGAAVAILAKEEGAIPVILDVDSAAGAELIRKLADGIFIATDLSQEEECEKAIVQTTEKYGRIDILVNNAGINDGVGLASSNQDFVNSLYRNLIHYFTLTRLCWPWLKTTLGTIVNVASKVAIVGQGDTSGYAAAKGGILAMTREWAVEGASYGVRANAVVPAEVYTDMYQYWLSERGNPEAMKAQIENSIPLGKRMTTAEEMAKSILYLASDMSSHTTGEFLHPDGGYVHIRGSQNTFYAKTN